MTHRQSAPAATAARAATAVRAVRAAAAAVGRPSESSRRQERLLRPAMCLCLALAGLGEQHPAGMRAQMDCARRYATRALDAPGRGPGAPYPYLSEVRDAFALSGN